MSAFIGTNLRLIRLFHDLSLTELGVRVGVSKQFLSRVETGAAVQELEDHLIANEAPEVIAESLKVLKEHFGVPQSTVAREMRVQPSLLQALLMSSNPEGADNVVSILSAGRSGRAVRDGMA